jgi:two-component system sporulation sensor kinase C
MTQATILGVQNQIERVVANIVSNALQAMGKNDQIAVEARDSSEGKVEMTISNTGSYIAPEDLENIFQALFTKGKADGTGLGLAICRRIVTDHGASINAYSDHSVGTRFVVIFPATKLS